jgi:hypothetical protein
MQSFDHSAIRPAGADEEQPHVRAVGAELFLLVRADAASLGQPLHLPFGFRDVRGRRHRAPGHWRLFTCSRV